MLTKFHGRKRLEGLRKPGIPRRTNGVLLEESEREFWTANEKEFGDKGFVGC